MHELIRPDEIKNGSIGHFNYILHRRENLTIQISCGYKCGGKSDMIVVFCDIPKTINISGRCLKCGKKLSATVDIFID